MSGILDGLSSMFSMPKAMSIADVYKLKGWADDRVLSDLDKLQLKDLTKGAGLFGLDSDQWGTIGDFGNLLGTGYDLYSSIWGDKSDLFNQQMKLMKQQYDMNEWLKGNYDQYSQNLGQGLAAAFGGSVPTTQSVTTSDPFTAASTVTQDTVLSPTVNTATPTTNNLASLAANAYGLGSQNRFMAPQSTQPRTATPTNPSGAQVQPRAQVNKSTN